LPISSGTIRVIKPRSKTWLWIGTGAALAGGATAAIIAAKEKANADERTRPLPEPPDDPKP
jgi:hypothetical protein